MLVIKASNTIISDSSFSSNLVLCEDNISQTYTARAPLKFPIWVIPRTSPCYLVDLDSRHLLRVVYEFKEGISFLTRYKEVPLIPQIHTLGFCNPVSIWLIFDCKHEVLEYQIQYQSTNALPYHLDNYLNRI